jgi:hypothetical protein
MKSLPGFLMILIIALSITGCVHPKSNKEKNDQTPPDREYAHYTIKLYINPLTGEINVSGLLVPGAGDTLQYMTFYLDRGMNVTAFGINDTLTFFQDSSKSDTRYMPEAQKITVGQTMAEPTRATEIYFSYDGKLSQLPEFFANTIREDWVEIGLYYPWFPLAKEINLFTYEIEVEIDPEYQVFGMGEIEHTGTIWKIRNETPSNDMVVCASKQIKLHQWDVSESTISLFHHSLADTMVTKLEADLTAIYSLLNTRYNTKKQHVAIIESKRTSGGGYARIGGVFLGGLDPNTYYSHNEAYYRYFAHELSHLWWYKAHTDTWEDWLNEGFAEYSALMVIRDVFGEEAFLRRIKAKQEAVEGTPPLWGFDRNNTDNENDARTVELLLYGKTAVVLFELESKIGSLQFMEFCKKLLSRNIQTTGQFLAVLKELHGEDTANWFEKLLRSL